MSKYFEYKDVKVMIAHKLMEMDGWKVYGYKPDESNITTDYYSPANWDGVAEKNGYILCVDIYEAAEPMEEVQYTNKNNVLEEKTVEKIKKLQQMTINRGASESEEKSAKERIKRLYEKSKIKNNHVRMIPAHMQNPPRCNWHIEKDGVVIAKGNGILKYSKISEYDKFGEYQDLKVYKEDKKLYAENCMKKFLGWGYTEERAKKATEKQLEEKERDIKLYVSFENFMNKINTTCGGLIGKGKEMTYQKVKETKFKTEWKPIETKNGTITEGQLFILKDDFNYGRDKGFVYRIHELELSGEKIYEAYKLNKKLTKECTGTANRSNYFYIGNDFMRWFQEGAIAWCELQEIKVPYEVEKLIKK